MHFITYSFLTGCLVPGAGAFEVAAHCELLKYKSEVKGRIQLGIQAFADAMLVIPKTLATNAGYDPQETTVKLIQDYQSTKSLVGIDINTGQLCYF